MIRAQSALIVFKKFAPDKALLSNVMSRKAGKGRVTYLLLTEMSVLGYRERGLDCLSEDGMV